MADNPNILFFLSDQHNPNILGSRGDHTVCTPTLDQLARDGVTFDSAYCQNPVCAPSRASLVTGQYSRDIGIYDNQHILDPLISTFPGELAKAGYRTCVIGKTHFNGDQFHGYQERPYGDILGQAHQPDPCRLPGKGPAGLGNLIEAGGPSGIPISLTQTEICVSEASKWLQCHASSRGDQPFCLSVHFDKPHFPICPPKAYFEKYVGKVDLPDLQDGFLEREVPFVRAAMENFGVGDPDRKNRKRHERTLAAYYGCIEWVDSAIGRILEVLDYLNLSGNTMVIYGSDHGEMAGARGTWQKSVFFEPSAKVPLIIRWSDKVKPEQVIKTPVGLIDLFPTFCDCAEIEIPQTCQGLSLSPLLKGDSDRLDRDFLFSESVVLNEPEHAGCMVRSGDWKYNYYLDGCEELYDLKRDPGEWNNLASHSVYESPKAKLREAVFKFWKPEQQMERYRACPRMPRQKHFHKYSNQFVLGGGEVVDARP